MSNKRSLPHLEHIGEKLEPLASVLTVQHRDLLARFSNRDDQKLIVAIISNTIRPHRTVRVDTYCNMVPGVPRTRIDEVLSQHRKPLTTVGLNYRAVIRDGSNYIPHTIRATGAHRGEGAQN